MRAGFLTLKQAAKIIGSLGGRPRIYPVEEQVYRKYIYPNLEDKTKGGGGSTDMWILATGFWNDSGIWIDTSNWID